MRWNWRKTVSGIVRLGVVLLTFSFVIQNLAFLDDLYSIPLPVGSLLLLVLVIAILYDIYITAEWYFTWLKNRKRLGSIIYVLIHFFLYSMIFYAILSVPMPILLQPDQPTVSQPVTIENITTSTPDNIRVMPGNSPPGQFNGTIENTELTDISKSEKDNIESGLSAEDEPGSGEADNAHTETAQDNISGYTSYYVTSPKTINCKYILRGNNSQIQYTVYGGLNEYLKSQPRYLKYSVNQSPPTDIDFIKRDLDNREQKILLDPLIEKIQDITPCKDDQARIAISLVQHIDYDFEGLKTGTIKGKYPYEVLYTGCGICSEKSELLAYMLRELGYGVAIFRFKTEKHDAVGIKCPQQYSYRNTGYCFVESTSPSIITDSSGDYIMTENSTNKLATMPEILEICDGSSFDSISEEYNDAITWNSIGTGKVLDEDTYNMWISLVNKYGMKTTKST
jgi:hypothetical protein